MQLSKPEIVAAPVSASIPKVVRTARGVGLAYGEVPAVRSPHAVAIRVHVAGICRTDLYVADGKIPCATPRILGHEFSGTVVECGREVTRVREGDRVAVNPFVPCGDCPACTCGSPPHLCWHRRMLGVDVDGAFSGIVIVPERCALPVPEGLGEFEAAYVEPVAAALAIDNVGLSPGTRGFVLGSGRIRELFLRVLHVRGLSAEGLDPEDLSRTTPACADFVVEAGATDRTLRAAVNLLRPGGILVLKSRPAAGIPIEVREVVRKELQVRGAEYGSFEAALELLSSSRLRVDDLLGPVLPIARFSEAFELARRSESQKVFLSPWGASCAG